MTDAYEPDPAAVFDMLERLCDGLDQTNRPLSQQLRAGFARGTGGVDADYLANSILDALAGASGLLTEAASVFRRYETLHRAKGTEDAEAKAVANGEIAGRIEVFLGAAQ